VSAPLFSVYVLINKLSAANTGVAGSSYQPDQKKMPEPEPAPAAGPSMPQPQPHAHAAMVPTPASGGVPVYHYVHPQTGHAITSLLPPQHPAMVCLQRGAHEPVARYGILGIIAAVLWFPLGVGLCLLDRRVKCARCGELVSGGLCD
jgi:hypothetical protein